MLQIPPTAWAGPGQGQENGTPSRPSAWVTGIQVLKPHLLLDWKQNSPDLHWAVWSDTQASQPATEL